LCWLENAVQSSPALVILSAVVNAALETQNEEQNSEDLTGSKIIFSSLRNHALQHSVKVQTKSTRAFGKSSSVLCRSRFQHIDVIALAFSDFELTLKIEK
jgi:hypothetical protein